MQSIKWLISAKGKIKNENKLRKPKSAISLV